MTIDERMRVKRFEMICMGKLQKKLCFTLDDIDKYEYLTGNDEIPPPQQFTYLRPPKVFEKQVKTVEEQGEKHVKMVEEQGQKQVEVLKPLNFKNKNQKLIADVIPTNNRK